MKAINRIPVVSQLLDVVCRTTGMGFSAIARVTDEKWVTCTTNDKISFGLKPGDELKLETTICNEVRQQNEAVFIDHVKEDPLYYCHPVPAMYGFESYVSVPIYRKDGSFFGTLCAIDPKPNKVTTPEIMGMFKLFADLISFHLQAIEEVDIATEKLAEERLNSELREQFIAILGHDLRNPIATTRMSADILMKISKEEFVKKQAKMIKSTSIRMEGLIGNMLDFARGKLGEGIKLQKNCDNGNLKNYLHQVIKEVETMSPDRTIKVNLEILEPVNVDCERVGQLLSNLLSNADTHGAEDHPIEVDAKVKNGEFRLSVKNSGEKIPEAAMKYLFQPFYRNQVKPGKEGLGLGLFIASEIAKAHEGALDVNSTEEETVFTFSMPL